MTRTIRRAAPAAFVLGALLVVLTPTFPHSFHPAMALDGTTPAEESPEVRWATAKQTAHGQIATKLEAVAAFAMGNKLKLTGIELFRVVLEFDTNNQRARRELAFDKKNDAWVENEYKQKKLAEVEDESEAKRGDYNKRAKEAEKAVGGILGALGKTADTLGFSEEAFTAWNRALEFDDQNADANRGVGNKLVEGTWYTERALAHREFKKTYEASLTKARALEVPVVAADAATSVGLPCGVALRVWETANFRMESNLGDGDIRETLVWLERARVFFLSLYEIPERLLDYSNGKSTSVVVTKKSDYEAIVEKSPLVPDDKRNFYKKFGGCPLEGKANLSVAENGDMAQRETIHTQVHTMGRDAFGNHAPWLFDALANSVSTALKQATLKVCFTGDGTTGGIHLENLPIDQAPSALLKWVKEKKDTPLEGLVKLPSDGLSAYEIAKAWSVLMFLLQKDRLQCREWLAGAGQGNDRSKDARILSSYFEAYKTWDDLDKEWREWALDVYRR
jgi:tetratricopeptide (TPR) repeat protein